MTPQPQARLWWNSSISAYHFVSPYNEALKDALLKAIPASDRNWNPQARVWTITERYADPLRNLLTVMGVNHTYVSKTQVEAAQQTASRTSANTASGLHKIDDVKCDFIKALPYEAALKAYRHAAILLHPDRGGDATRMSALNIAWQRIEKEVYNGGQK